MNEFAITQQRRRASPPRISVILPVYNTGNDLLGTFQRLSEMDLAEVELIVVDDGSTDCVTPRVIERALDEFEEVTVVTLRQNQGVAAARNVAVELARGNYVWFVDWDDEWDADILDVMYRRAQEATADIVIVKAVHTGFLNGRREQLVDGMDTDQVIDGATSLGLLLDGRIRGYLWSKLISRELLAGAPFPLLSSMSDLGGLVGVISKARRVAFVSGRAKYRHLVRLDSITNSRTPNLENLYIVREIVTDEVRRRGAASIPDLEDRLVVFRYQFGNLAAVNTALRLRCSPAEFQAVSHRAQADMSLAGILTVARRRPTVALRAALVLTLGVRYRTLYRTYTSSRLRVSNIAKRRRVDLARCSN